MRSPMRQTSRPRSLGVMRRQGPESNARLAAVTARLMSSLSLSGTRAMTEASAGLNTSRVLPEAAGTHLPAIRLCLVLASHAATSERIAGPERLREGWPLPPLPPRVAARAGWPARARLAARERLGSVWLSEGRACRSEEHTSELQSPCNLVCRL